MPYKDGWYEYELRLMDRGFKRRDVFWCIGHPHGGGGGCGPLNFDEDYWSRWELKDGAWAFRRLLKEFIAEHRNDYYADFTAIEIVKGVGYWKDLNPLIYEVWVKVKKGLEHKYRGLH